MRGEGRGAPLPPPAAPPSLRDDPCSSNGATRTYPPPSPETPTPLPPAPGPAILSGQRKTVATQSNNVAPRTNGQGYEGQVLRVGLGETPELAEARAALEGQKARRRNRAAKAAERRERRLEIDLVVGAYRLTVGEIEDRAAKHGTSADVVKRLAAEMAKQLTARAVQPSAPMPYFLAALDKELARRAVDGFKPRPRPGSLKPLSMWTSRQSPVDEPPATRVDPDLRRPT